MIGKTLNQWWSRKIIRLVLLPCLAGLVLAGVSVFRGWLHRHIGFDSEGKPLSTITARSPASKPRRVVTAVSTYQRIVEDLQRRDDETRPRLRYLTLRHRFNDPACTDAELEEDRRAVREMVVLLWHGQTSRLDFIDPEQIIFRLDLEELDWRPATEWRQVISTYRYGLSMEGEETLSALHRQVAHWTQDPIPVVRADWFVFALTRPPLAGSKGLLNVPTNGLPDAVRDLGRVYAGQTLDLDDCARELGLNDPKALSELILDRENLQQEFGLAPLLQGESIRREWWESELNLFSPYQEVARLLRIGKPVRVQ